MASQTIPQTSVTNCGYDDGSWHNGAGNFYLTGALDFVGGGTQVGACSFSPTSTIPAGSTINSCYCRLYVTATNSGQFQAKFAFQAVAPGSAVIWSSTNRPVGATYKTAVGQSSLLNWPDYSPPTYAFGPSDNAALILDLKNALQPIVDSYGAINSGSLLNIAFAAHLTINSTYALLGDANGANPPQLLIDWTAPAIVTLPPVAYHGMSAAVAGATR